MPIYRYEGINSLGKNIKATIKADGSNQAKMKVKALGVMISSIEEENQIKVELSQSQLDKEVFPSMTWPHDSAIGHTYQSTNSNC